MRKRARTPLSQDERDGIILAVNSAFRKVKNLYGKIVPVFESYGFSGFARWRNADAVVYLRIDATLGAKVWGRFAGAGTGLLATEHQALVLTTLKSHVESAPNGSFVRFLQDGGGQWRDVNGDENPYRPGETYVAFLKWDAALKHFIRYAADAMIKVENGRVSLPKTDLPGTEDGMSVEGFLAALRGLDGGK